MLNGYKREVFRCRRVGVRRQPAARPSRRLLRRVWRRRRRAAVQLPVLRTTPQLDRAADRGKSRLPPSSTVQEPQGLRRPRLSEFDDEARDSEVQVVGPGQRHGQQDAQFGVRGFWHRAQTGRRRSVLPAEFHRRCAGRSPHRLPVFGRWGTRGGNSEDRRLDTVDCRCPHGGIRSQGWQAASAAFAAAQLHWTVHRSWDTASW